MWFGTWRGRLLSRLRDFVIRDIMCRWPIAPRMGPLYAMLTIPFNTLERVPRCAAFDPLHLTTHGFPCCFIRSSPDYTMSHAGVASHYDDLDAFYREIWGEHVHHGVWHTGRESDLEAAENLVQDRSPISAASSRMTKCATSGAVMAPPRRSWPNAMARTSRA